MDDNSRSINVILTADLDMSGVNYEPPTAKFRGNFYGNGHTIKNLHRTVNAENGGAFGILFNETGNDYGAWKFGAVYDLVLKDCSITVTSAKEAFAGGFAGKIDRYNIYGLTFENVDVTLNATGNASAGLVAGLSEWGATRGTNSDIQIFDVTADAASSVTSDNNIVGGILGKHNQDPLYFHDITTAATVTSGGVAGGVLGRHNHQNNPKFVNCTVSGQVSGGTAGALIGDVYQGRDTPILSVMHFENKTNLEKTVGNIPGTVTKLEFYDDTAVWGVPPAVEGNVYLVGTPDELRWVAKMLNGDNNAYRIRLASDIRLTADIDMTGIEWNGIVEYHGTFDGAGYEISNLTRTVNGLNKDDMYCGLFVDKLGACAEERLFGSLRNVTFRDCSLSVTVTDPAKAKFNGGLVAVSNRGSFYDVTLKNVDMTFSGGIGNESALGFFAGYCYQGIVQDNDQRGEVDLQHYYNCRVDADCSLTAEGHVPNIGGIFGTYGQEHCFEINGCTVSGKMSGGNRVGGLVGQTTSTGNRWFMIVNSAFNGTIEDAVTAGGLVGYAFKNGTILNCTSKGTLAAKTTDPFVGQKQSESVNIQCTGCDCGLLAPKKAHTVSAYYQSRANADNPTATDLRLVFAGDYAKLTPLDSLTVTVTFRRADGSRVKGLVKTLGGGSDDFALFRSVTATGETLTAEEDCVLFGVVIKGIPAGAYDYFDLSVVASDGSTLTETSTQTVSHALAGKTFYFLGSSVTYGAASGGKSFVEFIAENNGATCVKEAVSGTTLMDKDGNSYVSRMKNMDKNKKVDHFIVQLSTNDATQNLALGAVSDSYEIDSFDTKTVIGAMEYIIAYVKETWGCPVTFYTGTSFNNNNYVRMIAALYELHDKWGVGIIDMAFDTGMSMTMEETSFYRAHMSDPIHPNLAGYQEWWTPVFEDYLKTH